MRNWIINIGIWIFLAVCILFCILLMAVNYRKVTFLECSLFNLLQLIAAVFIAIFVAHYLRNKYSDHQVQKKLFLEIVNDISKIIENETSSVLSFMQAGSRSKDERSRVFLLLKKIGNKITILEQHKNLFNESGKKLIVDIRNDHDLMRQFITDDYNFFTSKAYSKDNINKVLKSTFDMIFKLDQIKMNIFN